MTKIVNGTPVLAPLTPGMDTQNVWPTHSAEYGRGGLKLAANVADRDAIPRARRYQSLVLVIKGDDKYPHAYYWNGKKEDGSDGAWVETYIPGGFVLADTDGGLPTLVHTLVFSADFEVQSAGDQGGGALVQLAKKQGGSGNGLISVGTYGQGQTFSKGDTLELEWPLKAWPDADKAKAFRVSMDHTAFEPMHKPSFLAYLGREEEVSGKVARGGKGHREGTLWFDRIVWPMGVFMTSNMAEKSYMIEEADTLDPNVSGGTDYLVAFRANMKGTAPNDGFVRAYLYDKQVTPYSEKGYLLDKNGEPMVYERHYKQGDKLGVLEVLGVVNAKGQRAFTCHVVDNFVDDMVNITDPYEGESGLLIQALTKDSMTGMGLLQYEQDTQQSLHIGKMYLGVSRMDISWLVGQDTPMESGDAARGMTLADGLHFYNRTKMKMGVQSGHLIFQDDGRDITDFSFGKIFSAEETRMLRSKKIKVSLTITDKDSGWNVALMKWIGKPDEYSKEIFKSRNNGSPVFDTNWVKVQTGFISEDVVSGDHMEAFEWDVPGDANNYAVIIYPVEAQNPLLLKLAKFTVDVKEPFVGYALKAPVLLNENHLVFSAQYKEFVQNTQGYADLRYTINQSWLPMPVGEVGKGAADISLDPSVNKIPGSSAKGGEGAISFQTDGNVSGSVDLLLWNEQSSDSTVTFRLVRVDPDTGVVNGDTGDMIGEGGVSVPAGAKGVNHRFNFPETPVEAGERWALVAKSDKADGAFLQCVSDAKPLVKIDLTFKELVTATP
jgi:hypothetical protein